MMKAFCQRQRQNKLIGAMAIDGRRSFHVAAHLIDRFFGDNLCWFPAGAQCREHGGNRARIDRDGYRSAQAIASNVLFDIYLEIHRFQQFTRSCALAVGDVRRQPGNHAANSDSRMTLKSLQIESLEIWNTVRSRLPESHHRGDKSPPAADAYKREALPGAKYLLQVFSMNS